MSQTQKSHVRKAILRAAAVELAQAGYAGTTLASVAQKACTSIGNVYKYFANKEELFAATVTPELVITAKKLLRRRIEALGASRDVGALDKAHPYHRASAELLEFATMHRYELLFLLQNAQGTAYASFVENLTSGLSKLALAYGQRAYPTACFTAANRRALFRIYRGFLGMLGAILAQEHSQRSLRDAVFWLSTYHLAGLRAFFTAATPTG